MQEAEPGEITSESILKMINISITRQQRRWSKRAYNAIFEYNQNALVYMLPDTIDTEDWLYIHFNEIVDVSSTA